VCKSIQNSAFYGAQGHAENVHKQFHTRSRKPEAFPKDGPNPRDTGKLSVKGELEKAGRKSRAEEMATASQALRDPEMDGERILLLVQEAEVVTGIERRKEKAKFFFDKGSTCSMIQRCLVERLSLESLSKTLVVQTFRATSAMETEFVVVEMLHADGSITLLRAYVVEDITTMSAVDVPDDIKVGFKRDTPWPETRVSGDFDILIGMEELALHPTQLEIRDNLGIFISPLSSTTVLGGRHEKIHPAVTSLSQACLKLRSASSPSLQKSFKISSSGKGGVLDQWIPHIYVGDPTPLPVLPFEVSFYPSKGGGG
jgi:hypothetical protein